MVYTDGVHLIADSVDELHAFAQRIGLKRVWFQDHRHKHYDLTTGRMLNKALAAGAVMRTTRELVLLSKRK
jgi:hypothetical protein